MKLLIVTLYVLFLSSQSFGQQCTITTSETITPNSESKEEAQLIVKSNCEFLEFSLTVFNRWGNKVFESTDINISWDGMIEGTMAKSGTYFWLFSGMSDDEEVEQQGFVSLIN